MLNMDFISFVVLLVISVVVAGVLHFGLKYYVMPGLTSFCSKIVVGWIGAWLGTPVIGAWFPGVAYGGIYVIPAILGSLAMLIVAVDFMKMVTASKAE